MPGILITGSGMLASALAGEAAARGQQARLVPHSELDIRDTDALRQVLAQAGPDWILHTAALTRVDYCEQHPAEAEAVNARATQELAALAHEFGAGLVYFSTDYVFDGSRPLWTESSPPAPLNVYGRTKLAGERAVLALERGHVVRTSGVFGPRADGQEERNFFRAIAKRMLTEEGPVGVVDDQSTAVTFAPQLALMTLELLSSGNMQQVSHLTGHGFDTWFGWARHAVESAGLDTGRLEPISTESLGLPANRPANSRLGTENPALVALIARHPGRPAVAGYFAKVLSELSGGREYGGK